MKYVILVLFGFVSITSAFCANVSTYDKGWYVQPSAVYIFPKADYKAGWGGAISAGYNFNKHNAVEVELMSFKVESENHFNTSYSTTKTNLKSIPLLVSYRYSFTVGQRFNLFGGVSIGNSHETETETTTNYSVLTYQWEETGNQFLYGVQFGATYDLTQQISAILAVKIFGSNGNTGPVGYTLAQLGLIWRF